MSLRIYTIGHSTRPIQQFLGMLAGHGVHALADVRKVPRSGHNPQYASDALAGALRGQGMQYRHMPGLGGLRRPLPDSINLGWRNTSFRGYADYMQTAEFRDSLQQLLDWAGEQPTAIMCAEAVPWRCHRSLIADALLVRGVEVEEIASAEKSVPLKLHEFARTDGESITYPADPTQGELALS